MAQEFDSREAERQQREILARTQEARNLLTREVIDYYWDRKPSSEDAVRANRRAMKRYVDQARDLLDRISRDL